ncbi:MAG: hypothetical protein HFE68_01425 [Erysipelotrichaceae bacterium]|nr:hypothetical protein [Erysipelotrichaceae bacterium]
MINQLLDNCFLSEYTTSVSAVCAENDHHWHAFKETIFYMGGGGMAEDIGTINQQPVLAMKWADGKQWHLLAEPLEVGEKAFMSINFHERFRKCQIHTTQHMISALIANIYHADTISHHVGDEENEIEFNLDHFNDKMASELSVMCNGFIRDDLAVTIQYPSEQEALRHVPLVKANHETLRVVRIAQLDYNLCGCMHVPSLRYLQMVFISGYEKTSRGYKIRYLCGDQLLDCVNKRYQVLDEACQSLSLSHLYLNTGIQQIINEQKALNRDVMLWKQKYIALLAERYQDENASTIVRIFDDLDAKSLSQAAQYLTQHLHKPCILLAKIFDQCHLVISSPQGSDVDARNVFAQFAADFELRGGGNAHLAQGGGVYTKALADYVKDIQKLSQL